jgi:glutamine amidotransferase PdxT
MAPIRIGVLALQGSFREHMTLLNRIPGVEAVEIRTAEQLRSVSGLIIPGMPEFCKIAATNNSYPYLTLLLE